MVSKEELNTELYSPAQIKLKVHFGEPCTSAVVDILRGDPRTQTLNVSLEACYDE